MRYLFYCIQRTRRTEEMRCPSGVEGQPVFLVDGGGGLSAVISGIADGGPTLDLPQILAYEKVVEAFHRVGTVIPMRYGCLVEDKSAVIRLLEERCRLYEELLEELDGCEEMGIRIIPPSGDPSATLAVRPCLFVEGPTRGVSHTEGSIFPAPSGRQYLAAQRERYAAQDRLRHDEERGAERVCGHLSGLFVRSRIEPSILAGNRLISLYFLVPRVSVATFRAAFRDISSREESNLLLSGPWPPYNFARPDPKKPRGGLSLGARTTEM